MKTRVLLHHLARLLLEQEMFQVKFVEKIRTHILCSVMCPNNVPFMRYRYCGKILWCITGHRWQNNNMHSLCMLDIWGYKHTLRMCNSYWFFAVTKVTRTHHSVTYVHCLPCFRLECVTFKYSVHHYVTQSFASGFSQSISEYFFKLLAQELFFS